MNFLEEIVELIKGFAVLVLLVFSQLTSIPLVKTAPMEASSSARVESPIEPFTPVTTATPELVYQEKSNTTPRPGGEHYKLEPHPGGEEGFYVLKNTIPEPMSTEKELNEAVNAYRKTHNLNSLVIDEQLCGIADQRASEAKEVFSHQQFQEHIENGDYSHVDFSVIGENLWQGSFSGVHIVEFGWDRSPGHRANLQGDWVRGCSGINETTAVFIFAR